MGPVAVVFGLLCMRAAGAQLWSFVRKPQERMFWWYEHLQGFIGSYLAAWTAFSVVTLPTIFGNHLTVMSTLPFGCILRLLSFSHLLPPAVTAPSTVYRYPHRIQELPVIRMRNRRRVYTARVRQFRIIA